MGIKKTHISVVAFFILALNVNAQEPGLLAPTPPMGWNSWNKFGCNVSEKLIREVADAMVHSGMRDVGYEYIVIDDCWQTGRDSMGNIIADPQRFPSGMKTLADYVHARGLKFGLYSCAGSETCQGRPGSLGYQYQDARQYASWGVDYLKYDWCSNQGQNARSAYETMSKALKESGRPIVFSICEWGENKPWEWGKGIGHLWRTTSDIIDCFDCQVNWGGLGVLPILDRQVDLWEYAGPGHWNDPDMLEVGNGGQSFTEYKTHFSLWCILAAPLFAGNDIRSMSDSIKLILTNKDAIGIDQDALGLQGFKYLDYGDFEIWVKALSNGEAAFCFLNRSNRTHNFKHDWHKFGIYHPSIQLSGFNPWEKKYEIYDVWQHKIIGNTDHPLTMLIPPHDVLLVHLKIAGK